MERIRNILIATLSGCVLLLILILLGINVYQSRKLEERTDTDFLREEIATAIKEELLAEYPGMNEAELEELTEKVNISLEARMGERDNIDIETLTQGVREDLIAEGIPLDGEQYAQFSEKMTTIIREKYASWQEQLLQTQEQLQNMEQELVQNAEAQKQQAQWQESWSEKILGYASQEDVKNVKGTVSALTENVDKKYDSLEEKLKAQDANISDHLSSTKEELLTRLVAAEGHIENHETRITALEETAEQHTAQIGVQQNLLEYHSSQLSTQQEQLDACFQSVSSGKQLLASTLTDYGIATDASASFETLSGKILGLKEKAYTDGYAEGFAAGRPKDVDVEEIKHFHDTSSECYEEIRGMAVLRANYLYGSGDVMFCKAPHCHADSNCWTHRIYWANPDGTVTECGQMLVCSDGHPNTKGDDAHYYGYKVGDQKEYIYHAYTCGYSNGEICGYTLRW